MGGAAEEEEDDPDGAEGSSPSFEVAGVARPRWMKRPMQAVMTARGRVAASSKEVVFPSFQAVCAGATVYSALCSE